MEQHLDSPDVEITLLQIAELNALQQTLVIVKLLQFKDVEMEQHLDSQNAEMTLFQNAELNQNVTSFPQEIVEETVTTKLNVQLILATFQVDNATIPLTTTDVTITTNVLLIDVLHKDVFTLLKIALTITHVPKTFVMQALDPAFLLLFLAHLVTV
jgi:hypothetical protein